MRSTSCTRHAAGFDPRDLAAAGVRPVASSVDLEAARAARHGVTVSQDVIGYVVDLCRATRESPSVQLGVSPRGATALLAASRGVGVAVRPRLRDARRCEGLARPALRHRVELRPEAELEGGTADGLIDTVLANVAVPR